jgi:flagellar basal body-associated protein FliL
MAIDDLHSGYAYHQYTSYDGGLKLSHSTEVILIVIVVATLALSGIAVFYLAKKERDELARAKAP